MEQRLTPFGTSSLTIPARSTSREYKFREGLWTSVTNSNDLPFLLAHSVVLQEETPLADCAVVSNYPTRRVCKYSIRGCERRIEIEPGVQMTLPSHIGRLLMRRGFCSPVTAAEFLASHPQARIIITRDGGMGDVLFTTPAIMELARRFPKAEITYRTWDDNKRLLERCPGVARVVGMSEAYDAAPYDFQADLVWYVERHAHQHLGRIDLFGCALGVEVSDHQMHVWVGAEDLARAVEALAPATETGRRLVGVQVVNPNWRRIPSPQKMRGVAQMLWDNGMMPVLLGATPDSSWDDLGLNLCGKVDLSTFLGVVDALDALVVGDSGPLHIANALSKPVVALFGPVHPSVRVQDAAACHTLMMNEEIHCGPCNDHQLSRCSFPARCLDAIPDQAILAAVLEALHGSANNPSLGPCDSRAARDAVLLLPGRDG